MSGQEPAFRIRSLLAREQRKTLVILLLTPVLLTTFKYFGSKSFYLAHAYPAGEGPGPAPGAGHAAELYHFLAAFLLLGLVPALVVRLGFRERLRDYGLRAGDTGYGLRALLLLAPVMVALAWPGSRLSAFRAEYPIDPAAGASAAAFLGHLGLYLFYYLGWEFCFRGFLLFGLRPGLGDTGAILVQTLASTLVHIGKPAGETYGAIVAGVVWGCIALRARSFWPILILHWLLGASMDFFICTCPGR
jgi:uncharacterized protein